MNRYGLTAMVLLAHSVSSAAPMAAHDFAAGLPLTTPGNKAFYRLALPGAVYQGVAHADLRDLRIFNAEGEPVPFALWTPQPQTGQEFILLRPFVLTPAPASSAQVRISGDGNSWQWSSSASAQHGATVLLTVPTGSASRELSELDLEWSDNNWQQSVSIDASDDLQHWQALASDLPLLDVVHGADHLKQGQLSIPPTRARYWRLSLQSGHVPALTQVRGLLVPTPLDQPKVWLTPSSVTTTGPWQRVLHFRTAQQIDLLEVGLPQPNSVVPLLAEARFDAKSPWQAVSRAVLSRTNQTGGERLDERMPLALAAVHELRISGDPRMGGWGRGEPRFQVARSADQIVFNARGDAPYILAYGAASAATGALELGSLLTNASAAAVAALPQAGVGTQQILGGWGRLEAVSEAEKQSHWHTRLLWALLIGTTGLLATLAIKLARENLSATP